MRYYVHVSITFTNINVENDKNQKRAKHIQFIHISRTTSRKYFPLFGLKHCWLTAHPELN